MNKKLIIIVILLICLCAALVTAQHFANKEAESTTVPAVLTEAPQTDMPSENLAEDDSSTKTDEPQSAEQIAESSKQPAEGSSKNNSTSSDTSSSRQSTETKPQNTTQKTTKQQTSESSTKATTAPHSTTQKTTEKQISEKNSTQAATKAQTSAKESTSQTTTKPQSTTTTTTKPHNTTTTKPQTTATTEATTKAEKQAVTVTVSINCEKALEYGKNVPESEYFLTPCKFTAKQGDTVFDVLEAVAKENGISLRYQSKTYIQAINGLAERDCGGSSGWKYKVNGVKPNKSAAKYEITDGDIIEWYYALSPND